MAVHVRMALRRVVYGSLALLLAISAVELSDGLGGPALGIVLLAGLLLAAALAVGRHGRRSAGTTVFLFRSEANRRVLRASAGARWRPPFG